MDDTKYYPLSEVKYHDCLALLRQVMQKQGPAAQTLAAVRRLAYPKGETFASARTVADVACLSLRTVERHLATLVRSKWLDCLGCGGRRTVTYRLHKYLRDPDQSFRFAMLPR